ncbi:hypothetical protein J2S00_003664 [Caldalkalibacillus uzonensis]|uniref:Uncharacterized protein n=1 Tax=Caldalkalibacillus uzonensis TaxID=353224 RepID=A0ABU0CWM2_9BACI|nr:hypothetical protein [Caldalkalibacillus uzonensis]
MLGCLLTIKYSPTLCIEVIYTNSEEGGYIEPGPIY